MIAASTRAGAAATLLYFLAAGPGPAAEPALAASADPLASAWSSAQARWAAGEAWKPHRARMRFEELGADGRVLSWEEDELAFSYGPDPKRPKTEYLSAVKDGKDITAERRAKGGQGMGGPPGGGGGFPDPVPFSSVSGPRASRLALRRAGDGGWEQDYSISGKSAVKGQLRFAADGAPSGLSYSLDPLPPFMYVFDGAMTFSAGPGGSLVASSLGFRIEAGLLGIKKRVAVRLEFSDWRTLP